MTSDMQWLDSTPRPVRMQCAAARQSMAADSALLHSTALQHGALVRRVAQQPAVDQCYSPQPLADACTPALLQTKEDFPGNTKKLVDDMKTAGYQGGKVHLPAFTSASAFHSYLLRHRMQLQRQRRRALVSFSGGLAWTLLRRAADAH